MKVGVFNRDHSSHPGGDVVHITELSKALSRLGVDRVYYPDGRGDLAGCSLFHLHHINISWCTMEFEVAHRHPEIPYIVTCIFYETDSLGVSFKQMKAWLDKAAAVVVYSRREEAALRTLTLFQGPVVVIPPGVSPAFHYTTGENLEREGVITVAARGNDKGCSAVRDACRTLDIPYQHITGVSRQDLPAVYKKAKVFVNNSDHESFGLTILEGLAAGCRVLATTASWSLEWFPGIMPIDPHSQGGLEAALWLAYKAEKWNYNPNFAACEMTWTAEAIAMRSLYEQVTNAYMSDNQE